MPMNTQPTQPGMPNRSKLWKIRPETTSSPTVQNPAMQPARSRICLLYTSYIKPRIDLELLRQYSGGLIALSACLAGEIPRRLRNGEYENAKA